ncbi:MAG: TylF/MycF family methyltransferase, partial [Planctomycetota bacterium]|nr:TylF/MycF family methyltransferase [Planctomycetota bacterium]
MDRADAGNADIESILPLAREHGVVVRCFTRAGRGLCDGLLEKGVPPRAIMDRSATLLDCAYKGVPIIPPRNIADYPGCVFYVSNVEFASVRAELLDQGVPADKIFLARGLSDRAGAAAARGPDLPMRAEYNPDAFIYGCGYPEYDELLPKWKDGMRSNSGDLTRFFALLLNLAAIGARRVEGDFAELGVYKGNSAAILAHYAAAQGRRLYLFDTFAGFPDADRVGVDAGYPHFFADASLEAVKRLVGHGDVCRYVVGRFPESLPPEMTGNRFAFVSLDCDLYRPMKAGLAYFIPR